MLTSQGQAKRFFVDKIAAQAVMEGTWKRDVEADSNARAFTAKPSRY